MYGNAVCVRMLTDQLLVIRILMELHLALCELVTSADTEYPDELQNNQGLRFLLRRKLFSGNIKPETKSKVFISTYILIEYF